MKLNAKDIEQIFGLTISKYDVTVKEQRFGDAVIYKIFDGEIELIQVRIAQIGEMVQVGDKLSENFHKIPEKSLEKINRFSKEFIDERIKSQQLADWFAGQTSWMFGTIRPTLQPIPGTRELVFKLSEDSFLIELQRFVQGWKKDEIHLEEWQLNASPPAPDKLDGKGWHIMYFRQAASKDRPEYGALMWISSMTDGSIKLTIPPHLIFAWPFVKAFEEHFAQLSQLDSELVSQTIEPIKIENETLIKLPDILSDSFNIGELKSLCSDLNIKYDNLDSTTLDNMSRDLVAYMHRRKEIPELIKRVKELRPKVPL